VNVNNPEELKDLENSFRVILSTIPANMTINPIQTQHEAYDMSSLK
jgi:hypothetical protein